MPYPFFFLFLLCCSQLDPDPLSNALRYTNCIMTELFVTKAVVKLPKKTNANRLSHHLMVDTSADYSTMAAHASTTPKPHQQVSPLSEEYDSSFLVTDKLYIDGLPNSVIETEIMDLVKSCCPERYPYFL